jgi:hypothetical protein
MAETLGSLVDKLTIANIRLWHLEDVRRDRSLSDRERLLAADKIALVNQERNDLMDEINEFLYQALRGKAKVRVPKVKIYKEFKMETAADEKAESMARVHDQRKKASKKK